MARMNNPPHPGELIWDTAIRKESGVTVTEFAKRLGISTEALSRVLDGKAAISTELAVRLAATLSGSPESWMHLQLAYDFWHALKKRQRMIVPPTDSTLAVN